MSSATGLAAQSPYNVSSDKIFVSHTQVGEGIKYLEDITSKSAQGNNGRVNPQDADDINGKMARQFPGVFKGLEKMGDISSKIKPFVPRAGASTRSLTFSANNKEYVLTRLPFYLFNGTDQNKITMDSKTASRNSAASGRLEYGESPRDVVIKESKEEYFLPSSSRVSTSNFASPDQGGGKVKVKDDTVDVKTDAYTMFNIKEVEVKLGEIDMDSFVQQRNGEATIAHRTLEAFSLTSNYSELVSELKAIKAYRDNANSDKVNGEEFINFDQLIFLAEQLEREEVLESTPNSIDIKQGATVLNAIQSLIENENTPEDVCKEAQAVMQILTSDNFSDESLKSFESRFPALRVALRKQIAEILCKIGAGSDINDKKFGFNNDVKSSLKSLAQSPEKRAYAMQVAQAVEGIKEFTETRWFTLSEKGSNSEISFDITEIKKYMGEVNSKIDTIKQSLSQNMRTEKKAA